MPRLWPSDLTTLAARVLDLLRNITGTNEYIRCYISPSKCTCYALQFDNLLNRMLIALLQYFQGASG